MSTGLESWQYLVRDLHIDGLRCWSLFYQLETMVNFGSTSGDYAALFKGALFTIGIGEGARKSDLKMLVSILDDQQTAASGFLVVVVRKIRETNIIQIILM